MVRFSCTLSGRAEIEQIYAEEDPLKDQTGQILLTVAYEELH